MISCYKALNEKYLHVIKFIEGVDNFRYQLVHNNLSIVSLN